MASQRTRPVDIRTVAQRAGVSIATVSRVMNKVSSVDAKLAARVVKAARELNYTPNTQARALVSGRSRLIGLIVSEITNPFFPELIQAFEAAAVERGYEILIGSTNYSSERMTQCVRRMVERKVEGVAVMTFGMDEDLLQELAGRGIPVVSVGSTSRLESATSIEVDYHKGIREAVQHLAVMGHRDISFITGPPHLRAANLRQAAYVASMAEIGVKVPASYMIEGDHTMEGGFAAALQLFDRAHLPTAVLCSNDMTAIGVLHAVSSSRSASARGHLHHRLRRHSHGAVHRSSADQRAHGRHRSRDRGLQRAAVDTGVQYARDPEGTSACAHQTYRPPDQRLRAQGQSARHCR